MVIIGLTGGSGCGKSTVAQLLCEHGAAWIDTDAIYHDMISSDTPCTRALAKAFGNGILQTDGAVDRRALAALVFEDTPSGREALALLNRITHAYVKAECESLLRRYHGQNQHIVVLDVPLLYESNMDTMCNITVAVLAPIETRVRRIMVRDGISEDAAKKRINAGQADEYYKERTSRIIDNTGDLAALKMQVLELISACMNV